MNKKIWTILVCMLFIAIGVVTCNSENTFENTAPTAPECFYDWHNYTVLATSTDPESNQIRYGVSWWGHDTIDLWTDYYNSGVEVKIDVKGQKETADILAEDIYGARSPAVTVTELSKGKSIEYPMFYSLFEKLFRSFPLFEKILNIYNLI